MNNGPGRMMCKNPLNKYRRVLLGARADTEPRGGPQARRKSPTGARARERGFVLPPAHHCELLNRIEGK
jgi:hypothetical protein